MKKEEGGLERERAGLAGSKGLGGKRGRRKKCWEKGADSVDVEVKEEKT